MRAVILILPIFCLILLTGSLSTRLKGTTQLCLEEGGNRNEQNW